jgi:hypothetical protein
MAMETVLNQLEERIETLVEAYRGAVDRSGELEGRVAELEDELEGLRARLAEESDTNDRMATLEQQRTELAGRLEKVLAVVGAALEADPRAD